MSDPWHAQSIQQVFKALHTGEEGISQKEAARRLQESGKNVLPEGKREGLILVFVRQFQSPLIYILFGASALVFFIGEPVDAGVILAVLFFNAFIGAVQEGRAQNTLRALRNFVETKATVLREGAELILPDSEVVPGDVIILQEGERVPADARIVLANTLKVDEAALTGESTPVHKVADILAGTTISTSDQKNMVFRGTYLVAGNGKAAVVATGTKTVIGGIATEIEAVDTEMPLRRDIRILSRLIIAVVAFISASLFIFGTLSGRSAAEMFATVVALAVSVIPEWLPIVMTLVLATGVWRMSKRNALVKKLQAVEALGQ